MIDVKKFVVVFLVLAALASSSALIFSKISLLPKPDLDKTNITFGNSASGENNAFASATKFPNGNLIAGNPTSDDIEHNLTNSLAESVVDNIFTLNPNGPRNNAKGDQVISIPDGKELMEEINKSPAYDDIQVPNWDLEVDRFAVRIAPDSSASVAASYNEALEAIINKHFVKTNLSSAFQNFSGPTPDIALRASKEIGTALNDIASLTAPHNLADLQNDFIKVLVYEKNTLDLIADAQVDPLKTAIILENLSDDYDIALGEFQTSWNAALKAGTLSFGPIPKDENLANSLFADIFGIPKAHAFLAVVHDPINFAQKIKEWVSSILLQMIKNLLVTQLQNRVLRFIQGNGNPMFIQNWGGLVSNAFDVAAGSAIGQISPGLCENFSTDVGQWLRNTFSSARITSGGVSLNGSPGTNCTLQDSVNNIPGFYNDFSVGGWDGFVSLLVPNNNPFGAFAVAYDQTVTAGKAAANAEQNKAIASQGFKGQERCADGSDIRVPRTVCMYGDLVDGKSIGPSVCADKNGKILAAPITIPAGQCSDGSSPITLTPGAATEELFAKNGLGSSLELIVNANDLVGLVTTVATSLVQQLTNSVVSSLSGGGGDSGGLTGINPSPTPPTPPPQALTCAPAQVLASTTDMLIFSAAGGGNINYAWSAPGGNPSTGTGLTLSSQFGAAGSYTVTVTNPNSNTNTSASCAVTVN